MKASPLSIPDVMVFTPEVYGDHRGFFFESFNQRFFEESTTLNTTFVQDNHSKSQKGVLRGLHYQLPPMAQGKLVRVVSGEVYDVAVDLRKSSATFGKWVGEFLSAKNQKQLWVPEGFAHGFCVVSDHAELLYKTTNFYAPEYERCLAWDDDTLNISWPTETVLPQLSEKDSSALSWDEAEFFD